MPLERATLAAEAPERGGGGGGSMDSSSQSSSYSAASVVANSAHGGVAGGESGGAAGQTSPPGSAPAPRDWIVAIAPIKGVHWSKFCAGFGFAGRLPAYYAQAL